MAFGLRISQAIPIRVVLTISALSPAGAQTPGADHEPLPPYRPAAGAKDLRAVLFNSAGYMGTLRGVDEHKLISLLEHQPGQRVQYTCTQANGQTRTGIEVVSGECALSEETPGAELVPGKGKATPMPGAAEERQNGTVLRDVTTVQTETGSVYVIMTVPANGKDRNQSDGAPAGTREALRHCRPADPEAFVQPWVVTPKTLTLNANPEAGLLPERGNCEVYEIKNLSSQIPH
jgi:hypothetical protein